MTTRPFINIAWNRPFLPALIDVALDLTDGDISKACYIFPHTRPSLYMTDLIRMDARIPKPCVLPHMDSISGLFSLIRSSAHHTPDVGATTVSVLDQVALLLSVVRDLRETRGGLLRDLPLDDSKRFFPWGMRLANLMEELFIHSREPDDYIHMEDQVRPFAAALLENLGSIHAGYVAGLRTRGWTTPGFDAASVVHILAQGEDLSQLPGLSDKKIILAGFHTLTNSQHILFRALWERFGATICLHADPAIVPGGRKAHWSCLDFIRWASAWQTTIVPYDTAKLEEEPTPIITFKAGYDAHSQISELAKELQTLDAPQNTGESRAVVLPDTSLLMPVLHHLPEADRNISMGYPLGRSPLFRLVESILVLQETKRGAAPFGYYWKTLIALLRHPYLKMLDPMPAESDTSSPASLQSFRRFLQYAEQVVRNSRRFNSIMDLTERTTETFAKAEGVPPEDSIPALFARILNATVFLWEHIASPQDTAVALQELAAVMYDHGASLWKHFPIDAECLYRLTESVIPQLAHTALKEEHLPPETLFMVLRNLLAEERVPFEADPLVGEQILGVLETRLLHFDRIFILDMTEDRLPGAAGHDPLLPDSLRGLVGLPGKNGREKVAAYNFFRLINGARHVTLYWQEGVTAQGLSDTKKVRSRFVEELLWREEKNMGRIFTPEDPEKAGCDGPLHLISSVLPAVPCERKTIPATEAVKGRMHTILQGNLSPSLLDAYLHCPAQFFYQRIGRIREVEGVAEGRDPKGTGTFLHNVLRGYFTERLNTPIQADEASFQTLRETFLQELANSDIFKTLPADDRIMLEEATPPILRLILENHKGRIPRHVEEHFRAGLEVDGVTYSLGGCIDRVDEDSHGLIVLDFKTGHIPLINNTVWEDNALWERLAAWTPNSESDDPINDVAEAFASVQLPAYIHMMQNQTDKPVYDATYVPLRTGAKENALWGGKFPDDARVRAITEQIPLLFTFLLRHMSNVVSFSPKPGKNCDWCLYKKLCILLA